MTDLEAFAMFGLDASIQYFQDMGQFWLADADFTKFSTPEWRDEAEVISADPDHRIIHHTITTPGGTLTYKTAGNRMTTWITEYLIKHDEDIQLIEKYMPVPRLDPAPIGRAYDEVGDAGILRGFVWGDQAGCWQHAACLIDTQALILRHFDEPDWVHELLRILLEKKLRFIESMKGARFDLIETGGGAASSTAHLARPPRRVLPALRPEDARRPPRARLQDHLPHLRRDAGHRGADRRQRLRRLGDAGPDLDRRQPGAVGVQGQDRPAAWPSSAGSTSSTC